MSTIEFNEQLMSLSERLRYFALGLTRNMEDANDLIQESMLKALMNRDKYQEGTNFKAWMHTIVRNTFINEHRRNKRGMNILQNVAREDHPVANGRYAQGPLGMLSSKEMEEKLDRLPEQFRKPFRMNFEGYKYHEIADAMNIPVGTVKSRIFQARKRLMAELEHHSTAA